MRGLSSLSLKRPCPYGDIVLPHEAEVCDDGKCMVCRNGAFEDYEDKGVSKYGLHVSPGSA